MSKGKSRKASTQRHVAEIMPSGLYGLSPPRVNTWNQGVCYCYISIGIGLDGRTPHISMCKVKPHADFGSISVATVQGSLSVAAVQGRLELVS